MIVKKHKTHDGRLILAVCDSDLIGKKFNEGDMQLDLCSDFYQGEERSDEDIAKLFRCAYVVNLVGEKAVNLGLKEKIIDKAHVIQIKKIPHAQCVIVTEG